MARTPTRRTPTRPPPQQAGTTGAEPGVDGAGDQGRGDEPGEHVVENMTDTLRAMVGMGLSVGQIETMLSGLGLNLATVRGEVEKFVGSPSISLQRQSSIGLELLQDSQGNNDTLVAQVVASLESELEDPPERFRDPVSYNLMNEPRVIETGHVFDESTVFDENGDFRFDTCPMTRREIQPLAFPIVFLKKELIDYKLRRLDAVLAAAGRLPGGKPRDALLRVGKALLDQLGSGTYIHRAERYWTLRVDSMEPGPELVEVVGALAAEESVGKLDASSPLRALFDGATARLIDAGAATREGCDAMLIVYDVDGSPDELVDEDGELTIASREGNLVEVRALIEAGADVNITSSDGVTPLYCASWKGHDAVVRALIEAGADVNKADVGGESPLYRATEAGHEAVVRALIEAGADVNKADNEGMTPLYLASQEGNEAVVRALIEAGADVNMSDGRGMTPLYRASRNGHEVVVRALIGAGADVNISDIQGGTALHRASQEGHDAVVRALIEAGADVNMSDDRGMTPLYRASWNGHEAVVRALIDAGADVNKADNDGESPLYHGSREGHEVVVRALIEAGGDVNKADDGGETPLNRAAQEGHEVVVRALVEAGADVDKADNDGESPLYRASLDGHDAVVRALIEAGADVNKAANEGDSPLCCASWRGHEVVVRALIEAGADVNKADDRGMTPLYLASQEGNEAAVRALIEAGADVNKADNDGATPLYRASQEGHDAVVRALVEAGGDCEQGLRRSGSAAFNVGMLSSDLWAVLARVVFFAGIAAASFLSFAASFVLVAFGTVVFASAGDPLRLGGERRREYEVLDEDLEDRPAAPPL